MGDSKGEVSLGIVERLIDESRANDFSLILDGADMPIASSSNEDSVYYCDKTGTSNGVTFTENKVYRCIYDSEAQSSYSYAEVGEGLLCAIEQYNCFNKKSGKYRVTCLYLGANPLEVDPVFYAGTVWEKIENRMILGASSTKPAGSTGGSETHSLTAEENGPHGHDYATNIGGDYSGGLDAPVTQWLPNGSVKLASYLVRESGNGEPFSILNPYKAEVMYQRLPNNTVIS